MKFDSLDIEFLTSDRFFFFFSKMHLDFIEFIHFIRKSWEDMRVIKWNKHAS